MNEFIQSVLNRLAEIVNPVTLGDWLAEVMVGVIVGLIIFAAFYLIWRLVGLFFGPLLRRRFDETAVAFIETVLKYGILTIGLVSALESAGIRTSAVLASLGIVGLTIGFAARDALSNLISGILIFLDRPFVIGDLVELEGYYGRVERITLRSTRIVTSDGRMLAVPNTEVINKTVASYTNFPHLRLDIPVTIGVEESISRAREILLDLILHDSDYLDTPAPRVVVRALNDYNVQLELQAWLQDEREHVEKRSALTEKVFETLTAAGVHMPYETVQLAPLEVRIANS